MSKYLIKIGDKLYGYVDLMILKIHILENKPETYTIFVSETENWADVYRELDEDEAKELLGG